MIFKDMELDFDIFDADTADAYMEAVNAMQKAAEPKPEERLGDSIRRQCNAIFSFFDELFGDGFHAELFGERTNLMECLETYRDFIQAVSEQKSALDTWGWWSTEMSGADQTFLHVPTLTVTFTDEAGTPTPHSSAGITFGLCNTLPGIIHIKWYGLQGNLLADANFTPDRFEYFCEKQVENYSKVVITIPSMKYAGRYLRVTRLIFGALDVIDDARVSTAKITEEINPCSMTLPMNTLDLSFFTAGGRFSLLALSGAYQFFQWRQEIDAYKTVNGVRTFLGQFYLQEATGTVDAITKLSCVDIIGILDTLEYKGGIYAKLPVRTLLSEILAPEEVGFELDASFSGITISGYLPICTKREAIQQIAFAIGAVVDSTRAEVLRFYPAPTTATVSIQPDRKILGHKVTLEELVTQVDVTAHSYIVSIERKELTKATLDTGEHTITFPSPVSVAAVTGATIITVHPNYCVVQVAYAGEVVFSGYEYMDSTTIHTVKTSPMPVGAKSSIKAVTTATLVDPDKAPAVAQRLYDYYQNRYTDEGQILPGKERAAELATVSSLGSKSMTGHIERIVTDLSGGCLETVTLRGK